MYKLDLFAKGTRDQIANIHRIIEKAREFQKNIYFCFSDYAEDCVDHNKLWEILKEMGIPDHLTCLLRNLYVDQEAIAQTLNGKMDWFKIGKGMHQSCTLSLCFLTYRKSTLFKMPGSMNHKLGSRLQGETSRTSDTQMILL